MSKLARNAPVAILVTAILLTLPASLGPLRLSDSFWIDWVWLDQFAHELGRGVLYPRWLPLSHGGLGSPVFYYYPPLAFYPGAPFVLAGMSPFAALIATFLLGYILSGATMYWWLKAHSRQPLLGALVFMIAPYHSFNFYNRGAIAEFVATAILPAVMVGLWRLRRRERGGLVLTAIAYAALIATHLPLALLASTFLIGPWLVYETSKRRHAPAAEILALATGVALAAIYLVPAIWLEPYRDSAKLWANPILEPRNWSFWNPDFRTSAGYLAIVVIGAALALPLAGLIIRRRSSWALYGLACVLLALGLVPALWSLPILRSVQFPFRLLPLAEFALATAMARIAWRPATLGVAVAPLLVISGFIMAEKPAEQGVSMADVRDRHADVPENLPPGERRYSWPSRWALDVASSHQRPQFANGATIEPVFYFPAWQVRCAHGLVETFPDPQTKLLSYRGRGCTRALGLTGVEKVGAAISLVALLWLLTLSGFGLSAQRKRKQPPEPVR